MLVTFYPAVEIGTAAFQQTVFVHDAAVKIYPLLRMIRMNYFDAVDTHLDELNKRFIVDRASRMGNEGETPGLTENADRFLG